MKIKRKKRSIVIPKWLKWTMLFSSVFLMFYFVRAESISDISESNEEVSDETQDKIDELNRRAEIYRQIVEIKEKQGETLENQLSITDQTMKQVQNQIEMSSREIEELNDQIIRLEKQIDEKNELLKSQKKLLSNMIQSLYIINQNGMVFSFLEEGSLASVMIKKSRISQTGDKIKELVGSISDIKENLEKQKSDLDKKKTEITKKTEELKDKNDDLESVKQKRETLLTQTQGEEERYRQLLENIKKQKQELLDLEEYFAASGLSVDSYPKPPSSLYASTDWYYSQRDPKWADVKIGISGLTMKSYGCAISSVAMVFTVHDDDITPIKLVKKPIYTSGGLIVWPKESFGGKVSLASSGTSHGNINWKTIDSQIQNGNPIIVYIKKTKGDGGHYVVVHHKEESTGKYVVHDPYFGSNIYLDTSRALVGAMGTKSGTVVDQMIVYN